MPNDAAAPKPFKLDAGKPRFDLLPPEPLTELAILYGLGAQKYSDRGWESMAADPATRSKATFGRIFAAMMRHAWAAWRGEEFDPEWMAQGVKVHHWTAVAWGAFCLLTYTKRGIGTDDRPMPQPNRTPHSDQRI